MSVDARGRRAFLQLLPLVIVAASGTPLGCGDGDGDGDGDAEWPPPDSDPDDVLRAFPQGLGSGDPRPDSVILWTRAQPEDGEGGADVTVRYRVSTDEAGFDVVAEGTELVATAGTDHTVRLKLTGLEAHTRYYYRFAAGGVWSDVGRTRTAPGPDHDGPVRFAVASCQEYVGRWYHAWRALAELDEQGEEDGDGIDFVLFLGDYIYEAIGDPRFQELGSERALELPDGLPLDDTPGNVVAHTLADYRALYRQYRADADLRRIHARCAFVTVWDDHEFTNDAWQDVANEFDGVQGEERSTTRREAATQAWFEYLPVDTEHAPERGFPDDIITYRSLRFGRHVELVLTDQRYYRDDHVVPEGPAAPEVGKFLENSPLGARVLAIKDGFDAAEAAVRPTMLGETQKQWFIDAIRGSGATWKLWGSALMVAQLVIDLTAYEGIPELFRNAYYFKPDQWDGFRTERAELLAAVADIPDVVALSGDLHGFYASALRVDFDAPESPATAVEFTVSGISSITLFEQLDKFTREDPSLAGLGLEELVPEFDSNLMATGPHYVHADSARYGFGIVTAGVDELRVDFVELDDVLAPDYAPPTGQTSFRVRRGSPEIERL